MPRKPKRPGPGAPTKFSERLTQRIVALAAEGKTDEEIAEAVGICRSTLANWKGNKAGFLEAIQCAKSVADELVEAALFQRSVGYKAPAIKVFFDEKSLEVVVHQYTEHYPPDTQACKFWLQNRRPKKWRDVQKHEHSGKVTLEDLVVAPDKPGDDDDAK